jgi:methionyl-tRNA synthetase
MQKNNTKRDILLTMALPYANGQIHLGHMVEAIQTDIWARFQKLREHSVLFLSGTDAHGTAVMLAAEKEGVSPESYVANIRDDQLSDFKGFSIEFDNFYTTHSTENEQLACHIYQQLEQRGDISQQEISQAYDTEKNLFLADRFIKGDCPRCHAPDQYGDNCEQCGATYNPTELGNAKSALSGTTPIEKKSQHYFFALEHYTDFLKQWFEQGSHLQVAVRNKLSEWFNEGLKPWDISRDAPYFGFNIPGTNDKYFYVWLDAPIGYMASLKHLSKQRPEIDFDHYWKKDSNTELYHFIGKDIMYFHSLFWPAMLEGAGYRTPSAVFVHGFLTVDGKKMSKSRGTFITAKKYLSHLNPEYLRYYFAAKLNQHIEDIDFNLNDFMLRVNSDLVGKYVNLASRCAGFIVKKFDGQLSDDIHAPELLEHFIEQAETIASHYEALNYHRAVRDIMALADRANQYIDQHKPWALAKQDGQEALVQAVCSMGLNLFRILTIYLQPILPNTAEKVEAFLNLPPQHWLDIQKTLKNHTINKFTPLMQRITPEQLEQLKIQ